MAKWMRVSRQFVRPARVEEIAELAEAVADEHCPDGRVAPESIARANRITMSFGRYESAFDGMLEHLAGRFHIYCNLDRVGSADSPRARFTLAHELGHYYIDEHRNALAAGSAPAHRSQCEYESPNLAEQEADHFAANLLMPAWRFLARARQSPRGLEGIRKLAEWFGTSITATALRFANCDITPCAVVKWDWLLLEDAQQCHVSGPVPPYRGGPGRPARRLPHAQSPGARGAAEAGVLFGRHDCLGLVSSSKGGRVSRRDLHRAGHPVGAVWGADIPLSGGRRL